MSGLGLALRVFGRAPPRVPGVRFLSSARAPKAGGKSPSTVSPEEAVAIIASGNRVFLHSIAAAPQSLIRAMVARAPELRDVEIVHLHTEGPAPYSRPEYKDSFRTHALFIGANVRAAVNEGRGDYIPTFLSEVPLLFRRGVLPIDVAMLNVSPPDKHGFCSLGTSVDVSLAAMQTAKHVVAQVNRFVPRTHGEGIIHISHLDSVVEIDEPLPEAHEREPTPEQAAKFATISRHIAELIPNGACLQMGIGEIPNAVLAALGGHKHLGVHTEMFSDGLVPLLESGVVDNSKKAVMPGRTVAGFLNGSRRLYDFVDDNPSLSLMDMSFVNDTSVIRQNENHVSINSAIEIDLTGQICADSIGTRMFSGVGGQMDFVRGAALSKGGKPIFAMTARTERGDSKIVSMLRPGAGVTTTRAHVHYVVTEYGVVNLFGKSLSQRAKALISIAHPDDRERLEREAVERWKNFS